MASTRRKPSSELTPPTAVYRSSPSTRSWPDPSRRRRGATKLLLDQFACLEVDRLTAKASAALRRVHGWKLADSIQAALALNHGLMLVTRNHRHFKPADHAFVMVPYRL